MNIMELGAIGELVGGLAVVGSLLYVGLQVRQGNRLARAQVHQDASRMSTDLALSLDREMIGLFAQVASEPDAMDDVDLRFARSRFVAGVNYFETLFYANERGDVDPDLWDSRRFRMANFIAPAKNHLWESAKPAFGKRFRDFVDHELLPSYSVVSSPVAFGPHASD